MDLLATVRKEGSRGGTGDFKWEDVQSSSHREHYLGHSLHAPVGRWAKGRDLNWYAKGDSKEQDGTDDSAEKAAKERADEIRRIKEAEEDALSRALGLPVPVRSNPNTEPLGNPHEVNRLVKEATNNDAGGSGIGYSASSRMGGDAMAKTAANQKAQTEVVITAVKEIIIAGDMTAETEIVASTDNVHGQETETKIETGDGEYPARGIIPSEGIVIGAGLRNVILIDTIIAEGLLK